MNTAPQSYLIAFPQNHVFLKRSKKTYSVRPTPETAFIPKSLIFHSPLYGKIRLLQWGINYDWIRVIDQPILTGPYVFPPSLMPARFGPRDTFTIELENITDEDIKTQFALRCS